jgi:outer membrane protein assembly factor BamB
MRKLYLFLLLAIIGGIQISFAQSPSILWKFNTHDESFGNAAMGDLIGDGKLEIAFSCYWGDSNIYVLHAEDGSLLWKKNMGGCNDAAPIIYDVFGNGHKEIILGSSCNAVLTCFDGANGNIIWQKPFGGTDSPPSIADIDGDGKPEILVGDFEGRLNCYTADSGMLKWQVMVDDSAAIEASPALVDINGDGHPDIIVCTWSFAGNHDSTAVYAYDGMTHALLWKNPIPTDFIYHGAAFGPVSEDGHPELAISSYDGHVYLLNGPDGALKWDYPTPGLAYIGDPVVIGDINNDGHLELVYINGNGEVDALDRFGNLKWSFVMPLYESSFRGAVLADVNNDDTLDVVFVTSSGRLFALNGSRGNEIWNMNLRTDYGDSNFELEQGALISSFKQDDTVDIFVVGGHTFYPHIDSDFGRAYAIKVGKQEGKDWVMFQHDYTRSNCVCNPSPGAVNEQTRPALNVKDYPNPFTENIYFNLSLENATAVSIKIYNDAGALVKTFADKKMETGNYQFAWSGQNESGAKLAAGVYYCKIIAGNSTTTKKIVLVK